MAIGVVTCSTCGRELPGALIVCPHDGTRLGPAAMKRSAAELLRGPDKVPTIRQEDELGNTMPTQAPLTGLKLGDYVVGGILGTGGMGEVYEGEQPMIGKKVAIKVLKASIAGDKVNVARMLAEARAVNAIRHRGIVDIFNFGTLDDQRPYLVMEYLDGEPLDVILRKRTALTPLETVELLEEICSALAAAHGRGIVHRDLKPANVFVATDSSTRARYAKLLDFGLAKDNLAPREGQRPATAEGFVVGTPAYIAPEQARGLGVTPKSDLYALGVMAFEMVTGQLPFVASSAIELMSLHVNAPAPRVSAVTAGVPEPLENLIDALLRKDPVERPPSAAAVRKQLAAMKPALNEGATQTARPRGAEMAKRTEPIDPLAFTASELPTDSGVGGGEKVDRKALGTEPAPGATGSGRLMLAAVIGFMLLMLGAGAYFLLNQPAARPSALPPPDLVHNPVPGESPAHP